MLVSARARGALLDDLTPSQRRAVETQSATVCVMAAAGAGKTRVLTRRVAFRLDSGTARPGHVLAITFTRKAAGELRERLARPGLEDALLAATFHSFAWQQLRRFWADRRTPEPALLQSKARLVAELAKERPGLSDVSVADLAAAIEWAKARLVTPTSFEAAVKDAGRELPGEAQAVASLYARYEDEKRRRRLVDFDDLLGRYTEALRVDSGFASAQRWKWAHVFVDEVQDMNPLQCRLLLTLLEGNDDLFVVGDPNQAIYGWNGADPGFLTSLPVHFPGCEVVRLDENHRSSPQIVAAAAAVLGRQSGGPLRSLRPPGEPPTLRCFASDRAEAAGIASELREAYSGGQAWGDMAVLARTNAQLATIAETLARAGVPFLLAPHGGPDADPGEAEPGEAEPAPPAVAAGQRSHDAVTLCSFHRAKGLQWQAVWVSGLEAGFVPIAYATSPASLAEERRLLYVALTRAETGLHCSWARERRAANGTSLRRSPSPWLAALARSGTGTEEAASARRPRPATCSEVAAPFLAMARHRLARAQMPAVQEGQGASGKVASPGDWPAANALAAERLREWRRRLARASGVPPHVLLHDSTVLALARLMPSDTEALLSIPGLGAVKVARYGRAILDVLSEAASL